MYTIIIDVRTNKEFQKNHVDGAINIPVDKLDSKPKQLQSLKKDTPIITYCRSGNRSELAKQILENQGFKNVKNEINQKNIESN